MVLLSVEQNIDVEKPDLSGLEPDQQEPEFEPVSQPNNNFVGKPDFSGLEPDLSGLELDLSGLEPDLSDLEPDQHNQNLNLFHRPTTIL